MRWAKTVRGRTGSSLTLVDSRDHPVYQSWIVMVVGLEEGSNAKVQLTRKGLVALRNACTTAIALDKERP
jgi:hypothetical protein